MCLDALFGGGQTPPPVVQSSPIADQAKADAEAAGKSAQAKTQRLIQMLKQQGASDEAIAQQLGLSAEQARTLS